MIFFLYICVKKQKMKNFILEENISDSYTSNKVENIKGSHLTIAISVNFDSYEEKLTKDLSDMHEKKYIPVSPSGDYADKASKIVLKMNELGLEGRIVLNITGNGLARMSNTINQEQSDKFVFNLLSEIIKNDRLNSKIEIIRSGGQTGFEESGAKASLKLGIKTIVHMPKDFKMRNQDGNDVTMSKEAAMLRFNNSKKTVYIDMDDTICDYTSLWKIYKEKFPEVQYPQSKFGFFSRIKPIEGALEAILLLERYYNVYILTRPSFKNLHCYSEKAEWVERYLGERYLEKLILCPDKSLVIGDYLIDDYDKNGQTEFMGEFIKFKTEEFSDWAKVVKYLIKL